MPRTGFSSCRSKSMKGAHSRKGAMAPDMICMPKKRIPNPNMDEPAAFSCSLLENACRKKPAATSNKLYSVILKAIIWAVMVVPMAAPSRTGMVCLNCSSPAFTKLTSMTEVALLLCITVVTMVPIPAPTSRFRVTFPRMERNLSPADCCMPSLMVCIPKRNKPRPPKSPMSSM